MIGVSAELEITGKQRDARERNMQMAVITGAHLDIQDLMVELGSGQKAAVSVSELERHLKRTRPTLIKHAYFPRGKEDYLCKLYGALHGKGAVSALDATTSAKQLSRFMAYKSLDDVNAFVRDTILEPEDMSSAIREIAQLMRNVDAMHQESLQIQAGVQFLEQAATQGQKALGLIVNEQCSSYEHYTRAMHSAHREANDLGDRIRQFKSEVAQSEEKAKEVKTESQQKQEEAGRLKIQLESIPVIAQKKAIEANIQRLDRELAKSGAEVLQKEQLRQGQVTNLDNWKQCLSLQEEAVRALISDEPTLHDWNLRLKQTYQALNNPEIQVQSWAREGSTPGEAMSWLTPVRDLTSDLKEAVANVIDEWREKRYGQKRIREEANGAVESLENEIGQLERNQLRYPQDTTTALKLLQDQLPEAEPRVLCEYIEVTDPNWQMAIESIVGNQRFSIIVEPDYEEEAVSLIERSKLGRAIIIQGHRALTQGKGLVDRSIVHLMRIEDPIAQAYISAAYGNVEQIFHFSDLKRAARGVMANGRSAGSFTYRVSRLSDGDLVFGAAARQRALEAKKRQLPLLQEAFKKASEIERGIDRWVACSEKIVSVELAAAVEKMREQQSDLASEKRALDQLDITDHTELQEALRQLNGEIRALTDEREKLIRTASELGNEVKTLTKAQEEKQRDVTKFERLQSLYQGILTELVHCGATIELEQLLDQVDENLDQGTVLFLHNEDYQVSVMNAVQSLISRTMEFNRARIHNLQIVAVGLESTAPKPHEEPAVIAQFNVIKAVTDRVTQSLERLRDHVLAEHQQALANLSEQFNNIFVSNLCHGVYNKVGEGAEKLKRYNRKLSQHIFGREHYRFAYEFIPEYQDYYNFFKEVVELNQKSMDEHTLSLFAEETGGSLSEDGQRIFDDLKDKLLGKDGEPIDVAIEHLKHLTDYRNYRSYDILKVLPDNHQISLKDNASASGGQSESPGYVIRAAGLSSALKVEDSASALRMVLIDESFAKMDGPRSREVITYLSNTLGFQVIFVVPTIKMGTYVNLVNRQFEVIKTISPHRRGELDTLVTVSDKNLNSSTINILAGKDQQRIQAHYENMELMSLLAEFDGEGAHVNEA
ncbi:MAG: hypothetical protein HWE39_09975 [Oceanospirillaceae bacterium]|nr:hypothetical protein [Oceanospirillaceae bacterium]